MAEAMEKQMELFEDGGLEQDGGTVDPVSGNEVPMGSSQEEVRDDIPAQLSEGEFVLPADVVRYHGLEKLMNLRQEAKQGLKKMEAMGQMGNADEATVRDDLPFDETDIIAEDDDFKKIFIEKIFNAIWRDGLNMNDTIVINKVLKNMEINPETFFSKINEQKIKDNLRKLTDEALKKGIFGAPTFMVNKKIFWGQDRLAYAFEESKK